MFAGKHDKTMCTCTYAIVESVMDSYPLEAIDLACGNHQAKRSFRPRSFVLTGALVLSCCALLSTFVPAPRVASVTAPSANAGTAAALTAATLVTPQVAFADEGSVWIPALSAIGAGFAVGAVSWCGSQESGFVSPSKSEMNWCRSFVDFFFARKKSLTLNKWYQRALFALKLSSSEFSFESACTGVKESPLTNFTNLTSVGFTVI